MAGVSQQFCVRWNKHLGSLGAAFPQLLAGQRFVDVTLACDGHQVHCHRLVLAACSTYFESLLNENPCKHPIIILPKDVKLWEIQALVDFMYKGQVNVSQAGLPQLLKCAETLQIRGLCGTDSTLNEVAPHTDGNSDILPNSSNRTTASIPNSQNDFDDERQQQSQSQDQDQMSSQRQQQNYDANDGNAIHDENIVNILTDKLLKQMMNMPDHSLSGKDGLDVRRDIKSKRAKLVENDHSTNDNVHSVDTTNESCLELNIKSEEIDDSDVNIADEATEDDVDAHSNSKLQTEHNQPEVAILHLDNDFLVTSDNCKQSTTTTKLCKKLLNDIAISSDSDSHYPLIQKDSPKKLTKQKFNHSATSPRHFASNNGSIRVKSVENLFDNETTVREGSVNIDNFNRNKFLSENMSDIELKGDGDDDDDDDEPMMNELEHDTQATNGSRKGAISDWIQSNHDNRFFSEVDNVIDCDYSPHLPSSLRYNKNSMSIYLKSSTQGSGSNLREGIMSLDVNRKRKNTNAYNAMNKSNQEYENIICSPNFAHYKDDEDDDEDDYSGFKKITTTTSDEFESSKSASKIATDLSKTLSRNQGIQFKPSSQSHDINNKNNDPTLIPCELVKQHELQQSRMQISDESLLTPMRIRRNPSDIPTKQGDLLKMFNVKKEKNNDTRQLANPLRSAVVLRNPRGNQPRTYNTDSLYAALMDVKSGESIYRASQIHRVPRKTLRNWMKRWDIKSVYPMPYQLKQAAEKKRQIVKQSEGTASHNN